MRKLFLCGVFFISALLSKAQSDTSLVSLEKRLNEYMVINKQLDFERLFDYIHPNMYKIAPREQLVEAFKRTFNNDEVALGIDSIRQTQISETFLLNGASYRKVDYYMIMWLKTKDESSMDDSSFVEIMLAGLKEGFANKEVYFDKGRKAFMVKGNDKLVAIKDTPGSIWMFLGYQKGNPHTSKMMPEPVIKHFRLEEN